MIIFLDDGFATRMPAEGLASEAFIPRAMSISNGAKSCASVGMGARSERVTVRKARAGTGSAIGRVSVFGAKVFHDPFWSCFWLSP